MPYKLPSINVTIGGKEHVLDLEHDLTINPVDLDAEFVKHPGLYAFYAVSHAMSRDAGRRAKAERDAYRADLDTTIRSNWDSTSGRLTESAIERLIAGDTEFKARENAVNEAFHIENLLQAAVTAFEHKRDMLKELGRNTRVEYGEAGGISATLEVGKQMLRDRLAKKS